MGPFVHCYLHRSDGERDSQESASLSSKNLTVQPWAESPSLLTRFGHRLTPKALGQQTDSLMKLELHEKLHQCPRAQSHGLVFGICSCSQCSFNTFKSTQERPFNMDFCP